jgi:hypothetical protein
MIWSWFDLCKINIAKFCNRIALIIINNCNVMTCVAKILTYKLISQKVFVVLLIHYFVGNKNRFFARCWFTPLKWFMFNIEFWTYYFLTGSWKHFKNKFTLRVVNRTKRSSINFVLSPMIWHYSDNPCLTLTNLTISIYNLKRNIKISFSKIYQNPFFTIVSDQY